jgi:tetratricopeptide (TPR) repeat protein
LAKNSHGQTRAVDFLIFFSGELFSTTLRRGCLPLAASELRQLTRKDKEFIKHLGRLQEMSEAIHHGQSEQVIEIYDQLPRSLQEEKFVLLLRLRAASELDEKTYEATVDALRAVSADDGSIDLLSVDSFVLKGDFQNALHCLDRLEQAVGFDSYLNVLKANLWIESGESAKAIPLCQTAIEEEPELELAYWILITAAIHLEEWDLVLATLLKLEDQFEMEFENLEEVELYEPFTKTSQYKEWLQRESGP